MSELVGIEARGSMEYRFSSKATPEEAEYLLTGDTMFSDGGGVPFEADTGQETEAQVNKSNGNTFVRASIGRAATERCFAEILSRPLPHVPGHDIIDKILIFPGWTRIYQRTLGETISNDHVGFLSLEELSSTRIFRDGLANVPVRCIASTNLAAQYWQTIGRAVSFETRNLHQSMKQTGELVVRAIVFWHSYFCKNQAVMPACRNNRSIVQ
jgi:hypothetical protein